MSTVVRFGPRRTLWSFALGILRFGSGTVATVSIVMAMLAAAVVSATPASAASLPRQVLWWDEEGTTFRVFGANEAVTIAIGTVDFRCDGFFPTADVYVLKSAGDVAGGSQFGLVDANGVPNTVIGSSGGLFSDTIAFTRPGGNLPGGTYSVVYDECQDGSFDPGVDSLFVNAFRVVVPVDAPPVAPLIAFAKDAAGDAKLVWQEAVKRIDTLGNLERFEQLFKCVSGNVLGCVEALSSELGIDEPPTVGSLASDLADQYLGGDFLKWLAKPPWEKVKDLAKDATNDMQKHYAALEADPPDPAYAGPTALAAITALDAPARDDVTRAQIALGVETASEGAVVEALLHAIERYQGAANAQDGQWALVHAREAQSLASLLSLQLPHTAAAAASLSDALTADTRAFDDAAEVWETVRARILTDGFNSQELAGFAVLGIPDSALGDLYGIVDELDVSGFDKAATIAALDAASSSATDAVAAFATTASLFGDAVSALLADPDIVDEVPVARAGGPYAASAGASIALDGSQSSAADTATYSWDLDGDGSFDDASGPAPIAAVPDPAVHTIGLQVEDELGSAIDYARIDVADANIAPVVEGTSPDDPVTVRVGESQLFQATATDGDADVVPIRWFLDGTFVSTGPAFLLAPAAGDVGPHRVSVIATDPSGASSADSWLIHVLERDLDGDGWPVNADCDESNAVVHPGVTEVIGNGLDDDCDPTTSDAAVDADADGSHAAVDCNEVDALVHPGATEVRGNGTDDDCDAGTTDVLEGRSIVVPWDSTGWRYLSGIGADDQPGFASPSFDDSSFLDGDAPFGSNTGCSPSVARSDWPTLTDVVARKTFDLPAGAHSMKVGVAFDNAVQVFVNGVDVSGGLVARDGCSGHANATWDVPDSALVAGENVLAVRGRDFGGVSFLDVTVVDVELGGVPVQSDQLVNATGDRSDMLLDGACDTGQTTPAGVPECTLRAAMEEANASADASDVRFAIPGAGPHTIDISGSLPTVHTPVVIDGTTQAGSSCPSGLMIEVAGHNGTGFGLSGPPSVVRGLAITGFGEGVHLYSANHVVACNHIGLRPDGATARGNGTGVLILDPGANDNRIGGSTVGDRNVISGNAAEGVGIVNGPHGNRIIGNYIGTDASGLVAVPNGLGVNSGTAHSNVVGGATTVAGSAPGNVIAGNSGAGVIAGRSQITVLGNRIGENVNGQPLGNATGVVLFFGGDGIQIGGAGIGEGNRIAWNSGHGVTSSTCCFPGVNSASVRGNSIVSNGGLGIAWGSGDNDHGDGDGGSNTSQNHPDLVAAERSATGLHLIGTLDSTPSSTFQIDAYANASCDPSGSGEGETYLGHFSVTTDAAAVAPIDVVLPVDVPAGSIVTETATDPGGHTSQFSPCLSVTRGEAGPGASIDADGSLLSSPHYDVDIDASPAHWDLLTGDAGTSRFTVTVTKGALTPAAEVLGELCAENQSDESAPVAGAVSITDGLEPDGPPVASAPVDVTAYPTLPPGGEACFDFAVPVPSDLATPGHELVVVGLVVVGTEVQVANEIVTLPDAATAVDPGALVRIDGTNDVLSFSEEGSQTFDRTYDCSDGPSEHVVGAGLVGEDPAATATVDVACHSLALTHDPRIFSAHTYSWSVQKSSTSPSFDLVVGTTTDVPYTVDVDAAAVDEVRLRDTIIVSNPTPVAAIVSLVGATTPGLTALDGSCDQTLPAVLAPDATLTCLVSTVVPDSTPRALDAIVITQARLFDSSGAATPSGSALLAGSLLSTAGTDEAIDRCVRVEDSLAGLLGTVCADVDMLPKRLAYAWTVGPFADVGGHAVENTATLASASSEQAIASAGIDGGLASSTFTITVNVIPSSGDDGCTYTTGYWKNHAGAKKAPDFVTALLPVWLGTAGGATSLNVTTASHALAVFSPARSSNGIEKLQAALLTAELNIASGASPTDAAATISAAHTYRATHAPSSWSGLAKTERSTVLGWFKTLDAYNSGAIGPGHCA